MGSFIDQVEITISGGKGGDGQTTFRREKYVPRGGPSGGDGGHGAAVVLQGDPRLRTLLDFTYKKIFTAPAGADGGSKQLTGKTGHNLIVRVPLGTVLYDADTGEKLGEIVLSGQELLVARGGKGGRGNSHFTNSVRQAPRIRERGLLGEERHLRMELQLLADVGLIGMPNAGKSSLLSRISAAHPQIASYPFTTLEPQLGVVRLDEHTEFVVADMPGLIEGAHAGVGLGDEFLRHIRRTRLLLHVLDAASVEGRDPLEDYAVINAELAAYAEEVSTLPQIAVLNKLDLPEAQENLPRLQEALTAQGVTTWPISAATGEGVTELMWETARRLRNLEEIQPSAEAPMYAELPAEPERPLAIVRRRPGLYEATGTAVERLMQQSDLSTHDGQHHYHVLLRRVGLFTALAQAGAQQGDSVVVAGKEFEYQEDDD
ncbi:MAG TPA: GTPase ObgE [Armatimonadota bacterium]|jgi:GTP-binding protein